MEIITSIFDIIIAMANWMWGPPLIILIGVGGLYASIRIGFIQITKVSYIFSQTFGKMFSKAEKKGEITPFSAAVAALASSIGASNIVGVPVAIAIGGPGAIFWMWVLGIIGAGTKYVEVALGQKYREKNEDGEWVGGPYYYLKKGLGGPIGKFLGIFFTFFLMLELIPSITTQAASATSQVVAYGLDQRIVGIILAVLVGIVCIGGLKRITTVTDKMVPFMAVAYLLGALIIIFVNIDKVPSAFIWIFEGAFGGTAAAGGFAGSTVALALRWGAARGVYSNEAGMGTAPIAHSSAHVDHPIRQAMWGVFEVTVDTMMICTVTALAVLTSGAWMFEGASENTGGIAQAAYNSVFGAFGTTFVSVSVFLFVVSTLIVLVYYGQRQAEFLFGVGFSKIWRFVYIAAIAIGGLGIELAVLYSVTDFLLGLIILPNMIGVIILVPQVKKLQNEFFNTPGLYYLADKAAKAEKKALKNK